MRWSTCNGLETSKKKPNLRYIIVKCTRRAGRYLVLEDVKFGVYMKSYMEWNIDDERWSQRYVGLESYLIEKGELKGFVRNPALEITTKSFYSNIDGVDKNLKFYAGMCGKGEPAQGVPVWFGGPNVKLKNIRLRVVA